MAKIHKLLVYNKSDTKGSLSFNIRVPVDEEHYNNIAQHHKRRLIAQTTPIVIPISQSRDLCELTGLSPSQIRQDFEFNKILKKSNHLQVLEEIEYEDPEGFYPVRL